MTAILAAILPVISSVIDKVIPDKEAAEKAKNEAQMQILSHSAEMDKAAANIVLAEANSQKTLTSQWRPILMLSITAILINNFLIAPYAQALFGASVTLDMPDELWQLLNIGVGGYVVGRSGEKIADSLFKKNLK
ncbi:MAG: 3TM-type holin [Alphaproteobacteria bacterium]